MTFSSILLATMFIGGTPDLCSWVVEVTDHTTQEVRTFRPITGKQLDLPSFGDVSCMALVAATTEEERGKTQTASLVCAATTGSSSIAFSSRARAMRLKGDTFISDAGLANLMVRTKEAGKEAGFEILARCGI